MPELWKHKKRGTTYEVLGDAELQCAADFDLFEGQRLTVYRGLDGKLWVRPTEEFHDGRFEPVDAPATR